MDKQMNYPKCNKSDEVVTLDDGSRYCLDCDEKVVTASIDSNGLVVDLATGKPVGIMTPIRGDIRATCNECGQSITATKVGDWIHSDGRLMMHVPSPKRF